MTEPSFSIDFSARVVAVDGPIAKGDALLFDPSYEYTDGTVGYWIKATAANRAAAASGTDGIALTAFGGSPIGKVAYQAAGVLSAEVSGLAAVDASVGVKLVRVSTLGRLERIDSYSVADDVVGLARPNGRVALFIGMPWSFIAALAGEQPAPDPVSLENIGGGAELYAGTVADIARIRTLVGTGVATALVVGSTVEINVPAASVGSVEGENIGGDGIGVYSGLSGAGKLQFFKIIGTGVAAVSQVGDNVVVNVPANPPSTTVTIGGLAGDLMIKVDADELEGLTGVEDEVAIRRNGEWTTEAVAEVPTGVEDDVVGLDGLGGLKNLGPMPSGGGGGGGGTSNVVLGGSAPQLLYKSGTDTIAGTPWTYASNGFFPPALGYISWTGTVASKGRFRFANASSDATALWAMRSASSTDMVGSGMSADSLYLCCGSLISDPFPNGYIYPRDYLYLGVDRDTCLRFVKGSLVSYGEQYAPIIGGGGKPYGLNGEVNAGSGWVQPSPPTPTYTKTASTLDLSKYVWKFPPPSGVAAYLLIYTVPLPTNQVEAYTKYVHIPVDGSVTFTTGSFSRTVVGPADGTLAVTTDGVYFGGTEA